MTIRREVGLLQVFRLLDWFFQCSNHNNKLADCLTSFIAFSLPLYGVLPYFTVQDDKLTRLTKTTLTTPLVASVGHLTFTLQVAAVLRESPSLEQSNCSFLLLPLFLSASFSFLHLLTSHLYTACSRRNCCVAILPRLTCVGVLAWRDRGVKLWWCVDA